MASSTTKLSQTQHYQIRSFSLPSKLNPINQRIEEKLKKLRAKEESSKSASETIHIGLSGISELYECINEVLGLPLTQQALSLRQHEGSLRELLKTCLTLLCFCTSAREIVVQQKEIAESLQLSISSTNRKDQSLSIDRNVAKYNASRKEVIKRAKGGIHSLKKLEDGIFVSEDYQLLTVIKALRCVSIINMSVYESVLFFMSMPVLKPKWSLLSKLLKTAKSGNELNDVDIALHNLLSSEANDCDEKSRIAMRELKALVGVMEGIENGLESLCKQLNETKAFLMNILSF